MNRLWVRLSLMIGGVLFFVFFLQFLSIVTSNDEPFDADAPPGMSANEDAPRDDGPGGESDAEIARRLVDFAVFSLFIGLAAGALIARVVTQPIAEMTTAARQLGKGDLAARVQPHGSREMADLANAFNHMADELAAAETMRANLMADVSHELRTPLTVLESNLRAALDHVYELNDVEIAGLHSQTRHLIRLVDDLRLLALAEAGQLTLEKAPTHLNALVTEALQALEPLAAERELSLLDATPKLPAVMVDAGRMRQVLFNLLFNALRHTPSLGTVSVSGEVLAEGITLTIADTGTGLDESDLEMVFDRFYRADRSRQRETGGTGLGLAIVKAIVDAHGGQVWAESDGRNLGSRFIFRLPYGRETTGTEK